MIDGIPIDQITKDHLQRLVDEEYSERRVIEYKEKLPGNGAEDTKEFLADVCSFANDSGGHLIYGITDKQDEKGQPTGEPEKIVGCKLSNPQQEIARWEQRIRDSIKPRIPRVETWPVDVGEDKENKYVVVIRIHKSWAAPHMVTKRPSPFYSRLTTGKYPMDIDQIRDAFLLRETAIDKLKRFRKERVDAIEKNKLDMDIIEGPKVVLHSIPLAAFHSMERFELISEERDYKSINPIGGVCLFPRPNYDGFVNYGPVDYQDIKSKSKVKYYTQVFRNGIIESMSSEIVKHDSKEMEDNFIAAARILLGNMIKFQKAIGVSPPIFIIMTFIDVEGIKMARPYNVPILPTVETGIDRAFLELPEMLLEGYGDQLDRKLKHIFDVLWQSASWDKCIHFRDDGTWIDRGN